jgi:hypothetical protein
MVPSDLHLALAGIDQHSTGIRQGKEAFRYRHGRAIGNPLQIKVRRLVL